MGANPKYFDASVANYVEVSSEFIKLLRAINVDPATSSALPTAQRWITKATALKLHIKETAAEALMSEYIAADLASIKSASDSVNDGLSDYDTMRQKFSGAPESAELDTFMRSASYGLATQLMYRDSLLFRNNAAKILKAREEAKSALLPKGKESLLKLQLQSFAPIFGIAMQPEAAQSPAVRAADEKRVAESSKPLPPQPPPAQAAPEPEKVAPVLPPQPPPPPEPVAAKEPEPEPAVGSLAVDVTILDLGGGTQKPSFRLVNGGQLTWGESDACFAELRKYKKESWPKGVTAPVYTYPGAPSRIYIMPVPKTQEQIDEERADGTASSGVSTQDTRAQQAGLQLIKETGL